MPFVLGLVYTMKCGLHSSPTHPAALGIRRCRAQRTAGQARSSSLPQTGNSSRDPPSPIRLMYTFSLPRVSSLGFGKITAVRSREGTGLSSVQGGDVARIPCRIIPLSHPRVAFTPCRIPPRRIPRALVLLGATKRSEYAARAVGGSNRVRRIVIPKRAAKRGRVGAGLELWRNQHPRRVWVAVLPLDEAMMTLAPPRPFRFLSTKSLCTHGVSFPRAWARART